MKRISALLNAKLTMYLLAFVALGYLSAFTWAALEEEPAMKVQEIGPEAWAEYKSWFKATEEPNTGDPTGFLDKKHRGEGAFRDVFANSKAEAVMKGEAGYPFPEGSIIVKEAFKDKKSYDAQKKPELTIMIKQAAGSAPSTNDWLFVMGASGKAKGAGMETKWGKFCGSCHIFAQTKDFSFMAGDMLKK